MQSPPLKDFSQWHWTANKVYVKQGKRKLYDIKINFQLEWRNRIIFYGYLIGGVWHRVLYGVWNAVINSPPVRCLWPSLTFGREFLNFTSLRVFINNIIRIHNYFHFHSFQLFHIALINVRKSLKSCMRMRMFGFYMTPLQKIRMIYPILLKVLSLVDV